jgi:hypothetical protein
LASWLRQNKAKGHCIIETPAAEALAVDSTVPGRAAPGGAGIATEGPPGTVGM